MAPVTYIGRTTTYQGKRLFDILSRLKNFGVGRIVYRYSFNECYKEPTYYIVKKVFPDMSDPTGESYAKDIMNRKLTRGKAVCQKIFRGEDQGDQMIMSGFKADWRLVPRDEEHRFLDQQHPVKEPKVIPTHAELPPLMEVVLKRKLERDNMDTSQKIMMPIVIKNRESRTNLDNS